MGLDKTAIKFIASQYQVKPFHNVLTLGRQDILLSGERIEAVLKGAGIRITETLPHTLDDIALFRCFNANVDSLDVSDYEGAKIIADLNKPLPEELHGKYDLVIDGGTMEHILDVKQVLDNIVLALLPGGRVMHLSPTSNFIGHGFYSFSPELFYHYYGMNLFINRRAYIYEYGNKPRYYSPRTYRGLKSSFKSKKPVMTYFVAEKR